LLTPPDNMTKVSDWIDGHVRHPLANYRMMYADAKTKKSKNNHHFREISELCVIVLRHVRHCSIVPCIPTASSNNKYHTLCRRKNAGDYLRSQPTECLRCYTVQKFTMDVRLKVRQIVAK